uniref:Granulins domain-containing protein n=1 Tax=Trichobilharzia regenti TaxID=157069 RepID=A0AA85J1Y1_TRIRE|nr:unnamed protein product [Trichobilharzia regenti]
MNRVLVYFCLLLCWASFVQPHLCPNHCLNGSCCEIGVGDFRCCPYANGVCCIDGKSCCPEGSRCDSGSGQCIYADGSIKPSRQISDAICCSDGKHCCPQGSVCDVTHQICKPLNTHQILEANNNNHNDNSNNDNNNFFDNLYLTKTSKPARANPNINQAKGIVGRKATNSSAKYLMSYTGTLCPDLLFECPSGTTCCPSTEEGWACCPFPDAVCCSDGEHCCPNGYSCDLASQRCVQQFTSASSPSDDNSKKPPASVSSLSHSTKIIKDIICPDGNFSCPSNTTCCQVTEGGWGCCPFPRAVCCSDRIHCCPEKTVCDLEEETCLDESGDIVAAMEPKSVPNNNNNDNTLHSLITICSDKKSACIGGTCCPGVDDQSSLCCPHENAVCCGDGKHCCPEGTVCDPTVGGCKPQEMQPPKPSSLSLFKKITALSVNSKGVHDDNDVDESSVSNVFSQLCPGGKSMCPDTSTCCKLSQGGGYACCPTRNGICCTGQNTCCPHGSRCLANGKCEKMSADVLSRTFAPRIIPSISVKELTKSPHFLASDYEKGRFNIEMASVSKPAERNVFLLYERYRSLKQRLHTICPDFMHFCVESEQCCPSRRFGYTCSPKEAKCCGSSVDTFCSKSKQCSVDGKFCL